MLPSGVGSPSLSCDIGLWSCWSRGDPPIAAVTDRDIVVNCVADGADPSTVTVERFCGDKPVTIGADDSVVEALRTMIEHGVRRLPVIDGHDLIGMLSQADIAKNLPDGQTAQLVESISAAPANN